MKIFRRLAPAPASSAPAPVSPARSMALFRAAPRDCSVLLPSDLTPSPSPGDLPALHCSVTSLAGRPLLTVNHAPPQLSSVVQQPRVGQALPTRLSSQCKYTSFFFLRTTVCRKQRQKGTSDNLLRFMVLFPFSSCV